MAGATSDVFRLCYWKTWNVLCLIVACSVISASAQQVRCFRSLTCGGTDFFMADSVEECCLSDDGLLVEITPGSEVCEICVVFGWISSATDPNNNNRKTIRFPETGETQQLVVGFSKGIPTIDSYDVQLRGTVTEGTATQGAIADFKLEEDIGNILVSFARVNGVEQGGPTTTVPALIQIDNVALEPDEDFMLSFEVVMPTSPDNILSGAAVVLVNELQVFIEDQTDFTVQFTEFDYSQDEDRDSLPVAVFISTEIASDLQLRIITQNLTQVYTPLPDGGVQEPPVVPLPDGFAMLDPFDPDQPYIARSVDGLVARVDYDTSTQFITFTAGPARTIQAPVTVFDDDIDEADEEYFVMFLVTDDPRVDLTNGRFASRGIIRDNEITRIGFEMDSYTFLESPPPLKYIPVIREDNQPSELTFIVRVLYTSLTAIRQVDFTSQEIFDDELAPEDDYVPIPVYIIDDNLSEGTESFSLDISSIGHVPFSAGRFPSATVFIVDDEDVLIGFEETEFTVPEDVGQVELCLVVIASAADVNFTDTYRIGAETVEGTATSADYVEIVGFGSPQLFFTNESHRHCFNVTITDDMLFEESETFTVEARENPPSFTDIDGVSIHPTQSIVTITITNSDIAVLEVNDKEAPENIGSVIVTIKNVNIGHNDSVSFSVMTREYTGDGATATADKDFRSLDLTPVVLRQGDVSAEVTVTIIDDDLLEQTEQFEVVIVEAPNAKLQKPVGVITIIDDETDTSSSVSVETIAGVVIAVVVLAAIVITASVIIVFYCRQRKMRREMNTRTDKRSGNDIPMAECAAYGEVKVQEDDYKKVYEEIPI